jgi:hypothetical protein
MKVHSAIVVLCITLLMGLCLCAYMSWSCNCQFMCNLSLSISTPAGFIAAHGQSSREHVLGLAHLSLLHDALLCHRIYVPHRRSWIAYTNQSGARR